MRIGVISDIHANLAAFQKVLADLDTADVDLIVCLGDIIGYGPEPDAVVELIQQRRIPTVMGNHELAVADPTYLKWFNPIAAESLRKNIDLLSAESLKFVRNLQRFAVMYDNRFVHGFPPDSATIYQFQVTGKRLLRAFEITPEPVSFIGHTHDLEIIIFDGETADREPLSQGQIELDPQKRYFVNAGSVGQPRDGNNNAKYVIWDQATFTLDVRFIPYNIEQTVNKILALGLPKAHAMRLW
jgi:predicted phosphodiesterase